MGQRVLAERGGRGGWRGIGRECGEGRGRLGAGGEELFSVRRECFAEGHVLWDVRNRLRAASNEDVPWAHAFLRQKSCLHAWRVPYRHWRARFQTVLRLVSRQSRRSCSRLYSRSYRRVRSHCRSHLSPARPVRSWGWRRGSGSARRRAGRRRVSCTGRGCRRA